jgi:hypothetical protein
MRETRIAEVGGPQRSHWLQEILPGEPDCPVLVGDERADIVIVGGGLGRGFCGSTSTTQAAMSCCEAGFPCPQSLSRVWPSLCSVSLLVQRLSSRQSVSFARLAAACPGTRRWEASCPVFGWVPATNRDGRVGHSC